MFNAYEKCREIKKMAMSADYLTNNKKTFNIVSDKTIFGN